MKTYANRHDCILKLKFLPDPARPGNRTKAAGSFYSAVNAAGRHLLRNLANLSCGEACGAIRYVYNPANHCSSPQQRLKIYLLGHGHSLQHREHIAVLLENSPFRNLYDFDSCSEFSANTGIFNGCCDIIRKNSVVEPSVAAELNCQIPAGGYFVCEQFLPSNSNRLLEFANFLGNFTECILVDICVEPVDISGVITAHNQYLQQLRKINLNPDLAGGYSMGNWSSNNHPWKAVAQSLHIKDPLCDGLYRQHIRFHEDLTGQPHLKFHIRVFAETANTARLAASVLAETAFADGSYQLVSSERLEDFFTRAISYLENMNVLAADQKFKMSHPCDEQKTLIQLTNLATVDELSGVFQLPLAAMNTSPKTIPKDSDPPEIDPKDMIVIGSDCDFVGDSHFHTDPVLRGIAHKDLAKHVFIAGKSGKGKSTICTNILFQLNHYE